MDAHSNTESTSKAVRSRSEAIDALLGLAIIGVVYIHANSIGGNGWTALSIWWVWGVPVFIAYSAYFGALSLQRQGSSSYVRKRLIRLGIPFVLYSLLYFFVNADFSDLSLKDAITRHWSGYGWSGQYYFIILIQLALVWPLVGRLRLSWHMLVWTIIGFVVVSPFIAWWFASNELVSKIGDRPFVYWIPYVFTGLSLANCQSVVGSWTRLKSSLLLVCLSLLALLILVENRLWDSKGLSAGSIYLQASTYSIGSLWAIWGPTALSGCLPKGLLHLLAQLGRWSLGIFCLNPLVIIGVSRGIAISGSYCQKSCS